MSIPDCQPEFARSRPQGYVRALEKTCRTRVISMDAVERCRILEQKSGRNAAPRAAVVRLRSAFFNVRKSDEARLGLLIKGSGGGRGVVLGRLRKHCARPMCYDAVRAPWGTRCSSPP